MKRGYELLINGLAAFAGLLIAAVSLLIAWDVIARNSGLTPPASTVALTEYALLYFTMAAAPWLVRQRGHIVVESLQRRLPAGLRRILDRAIVLFCAAVCLLVALLAMLLAIEAWQRGEIEVRSLDMPRWVLFLPVTVGFLLSASEFLRLGLRGEACSTPPQEML